MADRAPHRVTELFIEWTVCWLTKARVEGLRGSFDWQKQWNTTKRAEHEHFEDAVERQRFPRGSDVVCVEGKVGKEVKREDEIIRTFTRNVRTLQVVHVLCILIWLVCSFQRNDIPTIGAF